MSVRGRSGYNKPRGGGGNMAGSYGGGGYSAAYDSSYSMGGYGGFGGGYGQDYTQDNLGGFGGGGFGMGGTLSAMGHTQGGMMGNMAQKEPVTPKDITTTLGKRPAFKLRKAIHPKSPLLLLNEMMSGKGKVTYEFYDVPARERERRAWFHGVDFNAIGDFDCVCVVGGSRYAGDGLNKNDARLVAAENAIKGEIAKRSDENYTCKQKMASEDYCPWPIIASLALYKMYEQWQQQGYVMPKELITLPNEGNEVKVSLAPPGTGAGGVAGTWMDRDNSEKPPLARVNEMMSRTGITGEYEMIDETEINGAKVFTMQLVIDGRHVYKATGKQKKQAKHDCAVAAIAESSKWYNPKVKKTREERQKEKQEQREANQETAMDTNDE